jgi:hypothetical protein
VDTVELSARYVQVAPRQGTHGEDYGVEVLL